MKIYDALERIIGHIEQDSFGGRDAPVVSLKDGTHVDEDGVLHGALQIHIAKRNGEVALLHQESLDGISDEQSLKDAFAFSLSTILSKHSSWPR